MSSNVTVGAGGAQRLGMTGQAMAAAVKAEHGHPGGARAGDAGHAVLDHQAAFGRWRPSVRPRTEQVRRRLAARNLRGGENMRRERVIEAGAGQAVTDLFRRAARGDAFRQLDRGDRLADMRDRAQVAGVELEVACLTCASKSSGSLRPSSASMIRRGFAVGDAEESFAAPARS